MKFLTITLAVAALFASVGLLLTFEAQAESLELQVSSVVVSEVGENSSSVTYEAMVEVTNTGSNDFNDIARVDYQIDNDARKIAYIVTELAAKNTVQFTFRFDLTPGKRILRVSIGDKVYEQDINVTAADLNVWINGHKLIKGGIVELDFSVANDGLRTANDVTLQGRWEEIGGDEATGSFGIEVGTLEPAGSAVLTTSFEMQRGTYRFYVSVFASTVETELEDNDVSVEYDIEFVELGLKLTSTEVMRWHLDRRGLMSISLEVANFGINHSGSLLLGIECPDTLCSTTRQIRSIAAGEIWTAVLEVWLPVGENNVILYVGGNEDSFRWGDNNVIQASINVPELPPSEWTLTNVSDMQEIKYWSDGSANVVFETRMVNAGNDLLSEELQITIECERSDGILDECGGEYRIEVDPTAHPQVTRHTLRVPQGVTTLYFSHLDETPFRTEATVPERILGVDRHVWDCFSDTSNVGQNVPKDLGVGCGGWRSEFVTKWPLGEPVRVWTNGDDEYKDIFNQVLDDIGPLLNIEFKHVWTKSKAQLLAYLGLPRGETRLEKLDCNYAAGCAWFEIVNNRTIHKAGLVVWPPANSGDQVGREHYIYSVALHELIHVLTGMLHRHDDRSSVMSYDSLSYKTLGRMDAELLRIASHPLVEPGTKLDEVGKLIVFKDELVDPPVAEEPTVEEMLRQVHAKLMNANSARFEISGGWPGCNFDMELSEYAIGGLKPRAPRWVHFKNDDINLYIIRAVSPVQSVEFWMELGGVWQRVPSIFTHTSLSFRDTFTNPLGLLSSTNIYSDFSEINVIEREENRLKLEYSLNGADVSVKWSRSIKLDVSMEIDTTNLEILSYTMNWTFDPNELGVCESYSVSARSIDYGFKFEFPNTIRRGSTLID